VAASERRWSLRLVADSTGQAEGLLTSVIGEGGRLKKKRKASAEFAIEKIIPAVCGSGTVESGEQCDDLPDGCDALCQVRRCGLAVNQTTPPPRRPGESARAGARLVAPGRQDYRIVTH
jgi:hypothetical protein